MEQEIAETRAFGRSNYTLYAPFHAVETVEDLKAKLTELQVATAPGKLNELESGHIYVADWYNSRFQIFSQTGDYLKNSDIMETSCTR